MKQMLVSYTAYEIWANERLLTVIRSLSPEQQQQEIVSSFPSLYKTCLHIWDASFIWWQRVHQAAQIVVPSLSFHPTMDEVAQELLEQNQQWLAWIEHATEADLVKELPYTTMKGDAFVQPVRFIIQHLANHGTYHRGQLVTMLRQLGVEKIPVTDYIAFTRNGS
ncbi:DinB family protein [Sediminibacterium soli]|uniref:DinB family protein n=1 Tax=Sediminibacterium soli TaxID=2698829 RepID=UPI00137A13C6|nr:DinB family protein [Sediminibacterium soli]NCI47995.1 hypothetical protein [Sediminibacterium soli]